mmetsp:Transcript_2121/g.6450  ORF Transcript_2121/g.6450 Transcript_2121/m.6450 type:complete len:133 (-) Transcript_2121:83-481(-)
MPLRCAVAAALVLAGTVRTAGAATYEHLGWRSACGNEACCTINATEYNTAGHMGGNSWEECRAACDQKPACLGYTYGNHKCKLLNSDPANYGVEGDVGATPGSGCWRKVTGGAPARQAAAAAAPAKDKKPDL